MLGMGSPMDQRAAAPVAYPSPGPLACLL